MITKRSTTNINFLCRNEENGDKVFAIKQFYIWLTQVTTDIMQAYALVDDYRPIELVHNES